MDDFANAIAFEVKQEIAERYFGLRTRIEEWSHRYLEQLRQADEELAAAIGLDLWRFRVLLEAPYLFHGFLRLIDLPGEDAIHLCGLNSPEPDPGGLFSHLRGGGLTRRQRFRSLASAVYCSLARNVAAYHEAARQLQLEHDDICLEIDRFRRQNDLTDILSFLRSLDSGNTERSRLLHSDAGGGGGTSTLDSDLQLKAPPPVSSVLLQLRLLPPLAEIKEPFTALLNEAYNEKTRNDPR